MSSFLEAKNEWQWSECYATEPENLRDVILLSNGSIVSLSTLMCIVQAGRYQPAAGTGPAPTC